MSSDLRHDQWTILNSVAVGGITYTRGEGLPSTITVGEIEHLAEAGMILRRGGLAPGMVPHTAEQYLQATDFIVLDNIAIHRPPADIVRAMEMLARQAGRSPILVGALRVAALYAGGPVARTKPEVEEEKDVEDEKQDEQESEEKEPESEEEAVVVPRPRRARRQ